MFFLLPIIVGGLLGALLLQDLKTKRQRKKSKETSTPEQNSKTLEDHDKYTVFDQNGSVLNSYPTLSEAHEEWENGARKNGSILDIESFVNLTPELSLLEKLWQWVKNGFRPIKKVIPRIRREDEPMSKPMTDTQVGDLYKSMKPGRGIGRQFHKANEEYMKKMVTAVDQLDLPVFYVAKKRVDTTRKIIPIRHLRQEITQRDVDIVEEKTKVVTTSRREPSIVPDNDLEIRRIRGLNELKRLSHRPALALPQEILGRRIANKNLAIREYQADVRDTCVTTEAVTRTITINEPKIVEEIEFREVSNEPEGQLLYILIDGSGSMYGTEMHMAAAVPLTILGRNLDNTSRYYYSLFDDGITYSSKGEDPKGKRRLVKDIMGHVGSSGGTSIRIALNHAAEKIRKVKNPQDQAEILLITDGHDYLTAHGVYEIIKDDIVLHTVQINASNDSLKAHSSTYVEIHGTGPENLRVRR